MAIYSYYLEVQGTLTDFIFYTDFYSEMIESFM